ncbi:actin-regulating kinase Prk1p [[Candida] anglica]
MPVPPPNAYAPNTILTVGSHSVKIIKYISAGGFAHVYTCTIDPPFRGNTTACLKRVAVPSKWQLNLLRQEVDAMKRLKGNKCIVSYIDSHASRMESKSKQEQQYEVFLLMEYCSRNGLIDFMNTRLTHKLTEPEILAVMRDVTTGVAMCHHLQPPLLHRDIKIENVLIDHDGTYKLCDFGSAVNYQPAPQTPQDVSALRDDIMQYTTPQYRAPEMLDLSRGFPIDDKSDVWALGCLLYKLCYYTTPFESSSHKSLQDMENQILHADHTLKIPHDQPGSIFSPRLKHVIQCCLREDPRRRPNAVQLLGEVCNMLGQQVPDVIPSALKHHSERRVKSQEERSTSPYVPARSPSKKSTPTPITYMASSAPPTFISQSSTMSNDFQKPKPIPKPQPKPQPKSNDPFASIDKSKLLQSDRMKPRPKSTYFESKKQSFESKSSLSSNYNRYSTSASSLKDFVQKQIDDSSQDLTAIRKSEDDNRGTLDFLRGKQEEQSTGGSFKMSFKNGLRKISTGGIGANGTGDSAHHYRRSSITSLKQILTGGSNRKVSTNSPDEDDLSQLKCEEKLPERKVSIKKRMAMLLNSSKDSNVDKTAHGYGRFTDLSKRNDTDDIEAINHPVTPSSSSSSSSDENSKKLNVLKSRKQKQLPKPPSIPPSLTSAPLLKSKRVPTLKKAPPKPKKPTYLKSGAGNRRLSTGSEISLPDIDDLEKEFSNRFPSKVL